jgi:DNA invertase Pin-like site-specific DNA recombinase
VKRFAEYLRFSSSPQDKKSSPEAHHRANLEYVQRQGGELVQTYKDVVSGRVRSREGWQRLLEDGKGRRFDAVVIYDITRAGRSAGITHQMAEEIIGLGLELHSTLHGQYTFDDEAGEFRFGVDALFAAVDYRRTLRRLYDSRVQAALKGEVLPAGRLPYGLRRAYDPQTGKPRAEYDPDRREWPQRIFEWADGGLGPTGISHTLNELGVPTGMGAGLWDHTVVLRMLRNRAFTGEWRLNYRRGVEAVIPIPPLVDRALFERVQHRLANLRKGGRRPAGSNLDVLPLMGILFCGLCGWRLKIGGKRAYPRSNRVGCANRYCSGIGYMRYGETQDACMALVAQAVKHKVSFLPTFPSVSPGPSQASKRKSLEAKRQRILEGYEAGLYTLAESRKRLDAIQAEIDALPVVQQPQEYQPAKLSSRLSPHQLRELELCFVFYPGARIVLAKYFTMR